MPRFTHTTYLYSTNILPVEQLAIVERVSHLHKMVKSLTKHNFDIKLNRDNHTQVTRQLDNIYCSNKHPALKQATHEYNRFCEDLRHLTCIDTFKSKLKVKVMKDCNEYNVISPYFYIN